MLMVNFHFLLQEIVVREKGYNLLYNLYLILFLYIYPQLCVLLQKHPLIILKFYLEERIYKYYFNYLKYNNNQKMILLLFIYL